MLRLDRLVKDHVFRNRSRAIQIAVEEKISRLEKNGFAKECANLDSALEQALAEEGMGADAQMT